MKILYFHQHFSTPKGSTGVRSYAMAKKMVNEGHEVIMVCGSYGGGKTGLDVPFEKGKREGVVEGINIIEFDIAYSNSDGLWLQCRSKIINEIDGHMGCGLFTEKNKLAWLKIINDLAVTYNIDLDKNIISVYFEWCGEGIQKNSAVSGLEKRAIIFQHFKVSPVENSVEANKDDGSYWLETKIV